MDQKQQHMIVENPGLVIHIQDLVNFKRATQRQKVLSHYSGELSSSNGDDSHQDLKSSSIDFMSIISQV